MADQKLTQLTAITSVSDDDLMYIVDDPAGTPLSRKITVLDFKQSFGLTDFSSNGNWKVFYTDGTGAVTELALGANDTVLRSNGAAAAPTFGSVPGDGDGIYTGSGTVPTSVTATLTDTLNFTGGSVGIGVTPLANFHVNGDTRTDGSYYITSERFMHSRYNSSESPATGGNVLLGAGVSTVLGGTGNEGKQNVIIGRLAGATADTMHQSVAVGTTALFNADKGRHLVAVGNSALNGLDPATDLSSDGTIGIGHQALYQLVDGTYNIGIGSLAGSNITGGSNNIHLGRATGASASGSYSVTLAIGENATVDTDRQMVFGSQAGAEYYEEAYFGAGIDATTITPTTFAMNLTGITTGQTDVAPDYHWEINGSVGTGTGVGGDIRFQVAPAGTTGTAQNALVEAMRIRGNGNIYANLPTYADDTAAGAGGLVTGDLYVETTSGNRHVSSKS